MPARAALAVPLLVVAATLAACSSDGVASCTPAPAAAPAMQLDPDTTMYADDADLSGDGRRLAVACDGEACVWDPVTGERLPPIPGGRSNLAWAGQDDDVLVTTGHDSGEEVGEVVLTTPDETCVMAGHDIGFATDGANTMTTLAVSGDGELLATAYDDQVGLWSVAERRRLDFLEPTLPTTSALAFDPTGDRLLVAGAGGPAQVWDVAEGERTAELDDVLTEVAWSPDGSAVAGQLEDGDLVVLDPATWEPTATLDADGARELVWSPDSARVAVVPPDEGLVVSAWTPATDDVERLARHDEQPLSALWAPDGSAVYTVDSVYGVRRTPLVDGSPSGEPTLFDAPEPIRG